MPATARKTDPATSHEAAKSITEEAITETQRAIIKLLGTKPMNDDQLFQMFHQGAENGYWNFASMSGVRSRRAELVKRGFVVSKGIEKTKFGRSCHVWGLK